MYLYGHNFKTIAIKGIPVDQSSCSSFNEMIHEYQVWKTDPYVAWSRNDQRTARKSVERLHGWLIFENIGLNLWQEAASINRY